MDDVTRAIKGMSDRAPGLDRRALNDLKRLRRDEVAAHFNVWLLAGYPPSPLHCGETVLITKEPGATSPEKHHPSTIVDIILWCFHQILASRFEATLPWNTRQTVFMKGDDSSVHQWPTTDGQSMHSAAHLGKT